jgi:hypothetical protein
VCVGVWPDRGAWRHSTAAPLPAPAPVAPNFFNFFIFFLVSGRKKNVLRHATAAPSLLQLQELIVVLIVVLIVAA